MANLSLELFTTGQGFSPIQVKGENMNYLVTAYHRKYVHLITFNAIISRHSTARAKRDMASSGQFILHSVHPKLQPTSGFDTNFFEQWSTGPPAQRIWWSYNFSGGPENKVSAHKFIRVYH